MRIHRNITRLLILSIVPIFALGASSRGVKQTTVTKTKFHGFMGSVMKMGGGDKPQTATTCVQGNQQRTDQFDEKGKLISTAIVDLDREIMINFDHKKKERTEMTFAQWKEMLSKMASSFSQPQPKAKKKGESAPEVKVDFDVKVTPTEETKTIAGYSTKKTILTMTATGTKEATPQEQGGKGGMGITSAMWLTENAPGYEELSAFGRKFAEKLGMDMSAAGAQSMLAALQSNPQLKDAMKKLAEEGQKMKGFALLTESKFETTATPGGQNPQMSAEDQEKAAKMPKSVGGLLGKMMPKPKSDDGSGSNVLYETTVETTELTTETFPASHFTAEAFANYKLVKHPMVNE